MYIGNRIGVNGETFDVFQVEICTCCLFLHANGECCEDADGVHDKFGSEWPSIADLTLGRLDHDICGDDCQGECGQAGFSWSPCGWCGSNLGGDREYAVVWLPSKETAIAQAKRALTDIKRVRGIAGQGAVASRLSEVAELRKFASLAK